MKFVCVYKLFRLHLEFTYPLLQHCQRASISLQFKIVNILLNNKIVLFKITLYSASRLKNKCHLDQLQNSLNSEAMFASLVLGIVRISAQSITSCKSSSPNLLYLIFYIISVYRVFTYLYYKGNTKCCTNAIIMSKIRTK